MGAPAAVELAAVDEHAEKDYLRHAAAGGGNDRQLGALEALLRAQAALDAAAGRVPAAAAVEAAAAVAAEGRRGRGGRAAAADSPRMEEEESAPVRGGAVGGGGGRAAKDVAHAEAQVAAAAGAARLMEPIGDPVARVAPAEAPQPANPQLFWPRQAEVEAVLAVADSTK